jgi:hypothetical protein
MLFRNILRRHLKVFAVDADALPRTNIEVVTRRGVLCVVCLYVCMHVE